MLFNLWSVLLIASASQCLFLVLFLASRKSANPTATRLLVALLAVVLLRNVGNLWYAARLFHEFPYLAGISRGTTLLIGPLFFLYTLAVVRPGFRLRWAHLGHLAGYLLGMFMISSQKGGGNMEEALMQIEAFLMDGLPITPLIFARFVLYTLHVIAYLLASRWVVQRATGQGQEYLISAQQRKRWLNQLTLVWVIVAASLAVMVVHIAITQYYSVQINYVSTLIYSGFVYLVAIQAFANNKALAPDFKQKYKAPAPQGGAGEWQARLQQLVEEEKVYTNPQLKLAQVAQQLNMAPHQFSALLNRELKLTFFEWLNQQRVQAFITLALNPAYDHLSIMGKAQEVGFSSKSSFNTAFKKITGTTPSQYIKTHRDTA